MSYCKRDGESRHVHSTSRTNFEENAGGYSEYGQFLLTGKDKTVFITKEDYDNPQAAEVVINEEEHGIILPNGEINWDCPCLGGMAQGPCGEEFKAAFSCFHYSTEESKGSDCIPQFRSMQECFQKHPDVYPTDEDEQGEGPGEVQSGKEKAEMSKEQQGLTESSEREKTEFVESMKEHSKQST